MNLYICSDLAKSRLFQHLKVLPIACFLIQSDVQGFTFAIFILHLQILFYMFHS